MSEVTQKDELLAFSQKDVPRDLYIASRKISGEIRGFQPDLLLFLGKSTVLVKTLLESVDPQILNDFKTVTLQGTLNELLIGKPVGSVSRKEGEALSHAFLKSLKDLHPQIFQELSRGNIKVGLVDDYISGGTKMTNSLRTIEGNGNKAIFLALSHETSGAGFDESYKVSPSTFSGKVIVGTTNPETHQYVVEAARLFSNSIRDNTTEPGAEVSELLSKIQHSVST